MKKIEFQVDGRSYSVGWLLSVSSVKTRKGEKRGYLTGILYLDPATLPSICPAKTAACFAACLKGSGNLGLEDGRNAMKTRTLYLQHYRAEFIGRLMLEINRFIARARRAGKIPAIRLNGTSDLPWESAKYLRVYQWIESNYPDCRIYDYTKIPGRARPEYLNSQGLKKYSVTFSWSGENIDQCKALLAAGVNVAVPFDVKRGKPLPKKFLGIKVLDGDVDDLRFLDPRGGKIIGLRYKLSFDTAFKGRKMIKPAIFVVTV